MLKLHSILLIFSRQTESSVHVYITLCFLLVSHWPFLITIGVSSRYNFNAWKQHSHMNIQWCKQEPSSSGTLVATLCVFCCSTSWQLPSRLLISAMSASSELGHDDHIQWSAVLSWNRTLFITPVDGAFIVVGLMLQFYKCRHFSSAGIKSPSKLPLVSMRLSSWCCIHRLL